MVAGALPSHLLDFQLQPVGARRRWNNVLHKQRYQARLQQHRDPTPHDDLGNELTSALRRAVGRQIEDDHTLAPHSTLHFAMQSDTLPHAFQSNTFVLRVFVDGSEQLDTYLQKLAQPLNSNEAFSLYNSLYKRKKIVF